MAISAANRLGAGSREVLPARSVDRAAGPRRVSILGSTGSVGQSTVDLLSRNREDFTVEALTANNNAKMLAEQARSLGARLAAIAEPGEYAVMKDALGGTRTVSGRGRAALRNAGDRPRDWMMGGIGRAAAPERSLAAT